MECGGYNYNEGDACGNTPLMEALRGGYLDTAKLLINAQACLTAKDVIGRTALHLAAEAGKTETVEVLVSTYGMDVNSASDKGGEITLYLLSFYIICCRKITQEYLQKNVLV